MMHSMSGSNRVPMYLTKLVCSMTASLFGCLPGHERGDHARTEQEGGDNTDAVGMLAVGRKGFGELLEQHQQRQLLVRYRDACRRVCQHARELKLVRHFRRPPWVGRPAAKASMRPLHSSAEA